MSTSLIWFPFSLVYDKSHQKGKLKLCVSTSVFITESCILMNISFVSHMVLVCDAEIRIIEWYLKRCCPVDSNTFFVANYSQHQQWTSTLFSSMRVLWRIIPLLNSRRNSNRNPDDCRSRERPPTTQGKGTRAARRAAGTSTRRCTAFSCVACWPRCPPAPSAGSTCTRWTRWHPFRGQWGARTARWPTSRPCESVLLRRSFSGVVVPPCWSWVWETRIRSSAKTFTLPSIAVVV